MREKLDRISGYSGIYRVRVCDENGILREPKKRKRFQVCVEVGSTDGQRRRVKRGFSTFHEAKAFRQSNAVKDAMRDASKPESKMIFGELVEMWKRDRLPHLEPSTQDRYSSYLQHFKPLMEFPVEKIKTTTIDSWITFVKRPEYLETLNKNRVGFDHELTVLRQILEYYRSRFSREYRTPFIREHARMVVVRQSVTVKKDLSVDEFRRFIESLRSFVFGAKHEVVYYIALMQYAIYGRIQDAAALHYEDFDFERGRIHVRNKVQWGRVRGREDRIVPGSKANGGKEIPMGDFATKAFREWVMRSGVRSGPLFLLDGKIVKYRQIVHRYDQALKASGLPFRGTHLIRHAALSEHYAAGRDILATADVAGHSDLKATKRYAKARHEDGIVVQRRMEEKLRNVFTES